MKPRTRIAVLVIVFTTSICLFGSEVPSKDPVLIWAARNNLGSVAKLLLDRGVDVNERDVMGNTPLHASVRHPEMVELLISRGADVNAVNLLGETPLHLAVKYRRTVEILLGKGADRRIANFIGRTAVDYCMDRGTGKANREIMELLIGK